MRLIYLGADVPSNRTLLETTTANHVGVSYWRLVQRGLPKKSHYLLKNYFKDDFYIYVHPGIPKDNRLSPEELDAFQAEYEEFIANNIERITTFNEINADWVPQSFVEQQRSTCWSQVPPIKFQPIWEPSTGFAELNKMAEYYLDIAVPGDALEAETQLATVARTLARKGTRFHILGSAKPDNLRSVPAETASTMSWLSPMMNGETIVWDGMKLVRYPKRMKDQARSRYRNVYLKAGINADRILEDDDKEVCRLAVWSYQQYEARLNGVSNEDFLSDKSEWSEVERSGESTPSDIDKKVGEVRKLEPRNPAEMGNLPVFGFNTTTEVEDDGTIKDVTTVSSQHVSLRMCDTCFVAANCPAFKPANTCAFKLPVEVKTKEQLRALLNAIIEMQGQRVAFMRFSEELNGGYADPNVSQEIDRLFKLVKTTKELDDSREFIRMTVERQGSAGVLSSIFGDKANVLKELPNEGLDEEQTTKIIKDLTEE
jgi:hypothetical protein